MQHSLKGKDSLPDIDIYLQAVLETVIDGIITINSTGIVQTFNPAAEKIFGYLAMEVIGKNVAMLMPEPYQEAHDSYISNYLETGEAKVIGIGREVSGKRKNGSTFPMDMSIGQMDIMGKRMFTGVVRDISRRRDAETALQINETRLSFLFDEIPVVTYNRDTCRDFAFTFLSQNVLNLFGYESGYFLDNSQFWKNGIHPEDVSGVTEDISQIFEKGSLTRTYRFRKFEGDYCWVEDGARLIYDKEGKPRSIIGYWMNIDERKQTEAALIEAKNAAEKANQAKSEFLSSMSHELRTPLNAILGYSQLHEYDTNLSHKQKGHVHEIYKAGEHLLGLVDEVLDLAKIETGSVNLSMENISVAEVLTDCKSLTESLASSRGISYEYEAKQFSDIFVHADFTRLKQVMLNLMSNAVKYNRVNGKVIIHYCALRAGSIRINISDTGPGLSEEKLSKLFQSFNRLGAEFSGIEGTGIGLVITKQLVEMMGGKIGVHSIVGKGSTFWVELNRYAGHEPARRQQYVEEETHKNSFSTPTSQSAQPSRILVAEDNVTNQLLISEQMQVLGYEVDITSNGREAWEHWQNGNYDVLLTDIQMPEMNGYQLVNKIRQAEDSGKGHMPIVAFTANAMDGETKRCLKAGMDDFLSKPVNLNELSVILAKWLPQVKNEESALELTESNIKGIQEPQVRSSNKPIDLSVLRQSVGDDSARHRCLLNSFVESSSQIIREIEDAFVSHRILQVAENAHKLKSSAAATGATELAAICVALETASNKGHREEAGALISQLNGLLESITLWLTSYDATEKNSIGSANSAVNNLKILVVDDDQMMLNLLTADIKKIGIQDIITATSGKIGLKLLEESKNSIDVVMCDLNMSEMDGVEFLRYLSQRQYDGGIVLISGEDSRILKSAEKLAVLHRLNILGAIEKPITTRTFSTLLDQLNIPRRKVIPPGLVTVTAEDLQRGIKNDELVTFFQPKVEVKTRKIVGVETLVRWQHPDRGLLMPDQFISVAEKNDLIDELTYLILFKALKYRTKWQSKGFDLKLAINISIDSLHNLDLPDIVISLLREMDIDPSSIMLEINESRMMEDIAVALEILTRLSLKKIGLSVDDFGTGYSSMLQLQRIPFTELKIDGSFVNGAAQDPSARAILESSIVLARKLNMHIVAEGVETQEDWNLISELGCDFAQGYFVAKPMPAEQLEKWLTEWN